MGTSLGGSLPPKNRTGYLQKFADLTLPLFHFAGVRA